SQSRRPDLASNERRLLRRATRVVRRVLQPVAGVKRSGPFWDLKSVLPYEETSITCAQGQSRRRARLLIAMRMTLLRYCQKADSCRINQPQRNSTSDWR